MSTDLGLPAAGGSRRPCEEFDRMQVRAWVEEASGASISVDESLPDSLIATAQAHGLSPIDLRLWVYDLPKQEWSASELAKWSAKRKVIDGAASEVSNA